MLMFSQGKILSQQQPAFKPLRYEEDYALVKSGSNWYYKMKFHPLRSDNSKWISIGGDIRYQYFYVQNENWGEEPQDKDGYLLTRILIHADFHAGKHIRTFVQLQSSMAGSRPSPSPVDANPLEIHQAFADYHFSTSAKSKLTIRLGRQELLYGSQRLISVREGPNNRQSFDAVRSIFTSGHYKLDIFYSHFVAAKKDILDDGFNKNVQFWGAYLVKNKAPIFQNIDLYYLGVWKRSASFDDGTGKEIRHSIGSRIWNSKGNWRYDVEGLYQFGDFSGKTISAWTASVSTSYKFNDAKLKPELNLKTELISGDKIYDDDKLQTFNPLFPRGAYFGLAALIGPANLVDIHPGISFTLTKELTVDLDYDAFWRYRSNDGLYAVNMDPVYTGKNTSQKYIGSQYAGSLVYKPNEFLYFRGELTWFAAGSYLKAAGTGKNILFTGVTAQLKF